jgi:hypothetical protein
MHVDAYGDTTVLSAQIGHDAPISTLIAIDGAVVMK